MFESTITVDGKNFRLVLDTWARVKTWQYIPAGMVPHLAHRYVVPAKLSTTYHHGKDGDFLKTQIDFSR